MVADCAPNSAGMHLFPETMTMASTKLLMSKVRDQLRIRRLIQESAADTLADPGIGCKHASRSRPLWLTSRSQSCEQTQEIHQTTCQVPPKLSVAIVLQQCTLQESAADTLADSTTSCFAKAPQLPRISARPFQVVASACSAFSAANSRNLSGA